MKKNVKASKLYELSDAQEMIRYMQNFSLHKQLTQIPASITLDEPFDFQLMKKAVDIEIARNDCMRLCFVRKGLGCLQYFAPELHLKDIPVLLFNSQQEQESSLLADAQKPVLPLSGETYRIILFRSFDGRRGIYINVSHLCMDAQAVFIFFNDLLAVYSALKDGKELPKPMGSFELALQEELKLKADTETILKAEAVEVEHLLRHQPPMYLGAHGIERLEAARKRRRNPYFSQPSCYNPLFDKVASVSFEASKEDSDRIFEFCGRSFVTPEVLIQTAMHTHLSSINHNSPDHCTFTMCVRRNNRNTKRCGGTLTAALLWRTTLPGELSFSQALEKMTDHQMFMFRNMDYPAVRCRYLLRTLFPAPLMSHPATMMFSWFGLNSKSMNNQGYDFRVYNFGRYWMPLYTIAMRDPRSGRLKITFLYRTHYIKREHLTALYENTIKAILWGVENPQITLEHIMEKF